MKIPTIVLSGCLFGALMLTACGGGGGGTPVSASQATITFPGAEAVTDAGSVRVRGTTSGPDAVTAVSVNGVPATSTDGFATFEAVVGLSPGSNDVTVALTDDKGLRRDGAAAARVRQVGLVMTGPRRVALERPRDSYLVLDIGNPAVVRVDRTSGATTLVSGAARGDGDELRYPYAIAYDAGGDRIFVGDLVTSRVFEVDPTTGDRRVIADRNSTTASGVSGLLERPAGLVVDNPGGRLFVVDMDTHAVCAVAIANGSVTLISGGDNAAPAHRRGSGPAIVQAEGLAWDEPGNRLLVPDSQARQIVAVDLTGGDREVVSSNSNAAGRDFNSPQDIVLDAARTSAFVPDGGEANGSPPTLLRVDLATGMRTIVSGDGTGEGTAFGLPGGIALDPDSGRALVTDDVLDAVITVDLQGPAAGRRSVHASAGVGSGDPLLATAGVAPDPRRGRLLIVDATNHRGMVMVTMDLRTGDRAQLAQLGGNLLSSTPDVALDEDRDRALVTDSSSSGSRVWAVDLVSGAPSELGTTGLALGDIAHIVVDRPRNRALLSRRNPTAGRRSELLQMDLDTLVVTPFGSWADIVDLEVDAANDRLLVLDTPTAGNTTLYAEDLATGRRETLSNSGTGTGPNLEGSRSLAVDTAGAQVLVTNQNGTEVLAVDLATGDRSHVSRSDRGTGPVLRQAEGIAVDGARAIVLDRAWTAAIGIDRRSGDRVISSK